MQRLPEVIKRKISLEKEDKYNGINDASVKDFIDKDDEDQQYTRKRASLILDNFLLLELIDQYKTLSMKVYTIQ